MLRDINLNVTSINTDVPAVVTNYYLSMLKFIILKNKNTTQFTLELKEDIDILTNTLGDDISSRVLEDIFDLKLLLIDSNLQLINVRYDISNYYKQKYIILIQLFKLNIRHAGYILHLLLDAVTSLNDEVILELVKTLILNYREVYLTSDSEFGKIHYTKVVELYDK